MLKPNQWPERGLNLACVQPYPPLKPKGSLSSDDGMQWQLPRHPESDFVLFQNSFMVRTTSDKQISRIFQGQITDFKD